MRPVQVNGINIYPFDSFNQIIDIIDAQKGALVAINAGKLDRSTQEIKDFINRNIGYADGYGATLAVKIKSKLKIKKLAGCELWLEIVKRFYRDRIFYLIGATQDVIEEVAEKLKTEYVGINIIGHRNGYINTREDEDNLLDTIKNLKPDIVFVAMGSPKQEELIQKLQNVNPNAIYQGLGGSFDVYVGKVKRAPEWTRKLGHGFEGLYRDITRIGSKSMRNRFFLNTKFIINLWLRKIQY